MKGLQRLNPPQREAVVHGEGPLLVLAGAGSGKTRVITHRIVHLLTELGAHPSQLLAVTFTNRATQEMRERVDHLMAEHGLEGQSGSITISTFHALGARLLRLHADRVGLNWGFSILDDTDQLRLIRQLMGQRDMEDSRGAARAMAAYIERMKNRAWTPKEAHEQAFRSEDEQNAWFYEAYQERLSLNNCADFGDLIMGSVRMFRDDPKLAASFSRQWRYIMVDEFQDTNPAQYELLQHLTCAHDNLVVVGDDDQAIYRWRGATVANLLNFERDYERAKVIKLEQNYRSTQHILDAAHDVIALNPERRDKRLWTEAGEGAQIVCFTARSDREEAEYVASRVQIACAGGASYDDFAIFFRTNAQARQFEEALRFAGVPYSIVGGTSFYRREEVKDVLAYLKIALNPENEVDVVRVINTPPRGVGDATLERLQSLATVPGIDTLYQAIRYVLGADMLLGADMPVIEPRPTEVLHEVALEMAEQIKGAQLSGVRDFHDTVQLLRDDLRRLEDPAEAARQLLEHIHYSGYLLSKHPEAAEDKERNVGELLGALQAFDEEFKHDPGLLIFKGSELLDGRNPQVDEPPAMSSLRAFLQHSALVDAPQDKEDGLIGGAVTLMTVHSAKGLEFNRVFLSGMEDEIFPSIRDREDPEEEQEERRLAYVAITRARQHLTITNAKTRHVYGQLKEMTPSRFLLDISPHHLTIDPKSVERSVDWQSRRNRSRRPVYTGADEAAHFYDPSTEDESLLFDQSPSYDYGQLTTPTPTRSRSTRNTRNTRSPATRRAASTPAYDEFAQVAYDEFSQLPPDELVDHVAPEQLIGAPVWHVRFGNGRVLGVKGTGDRAVIHVRFADGGTKKIMKQYLTFEF